MFCDGDVMFRDNVQNMFKGLDEKYALYCVKHNFSPTDKMKMDGQIQTAYSRKNWSSVMIFNCNHPSNKKLTVEMINTVPGRDLHRFCWLKDEEIGALDQKWNWLVGHSDQAILPSIVHFTDGVPDMPGFEHVDYAEEWREELARWAA
jgi:lipopolysaccharide biosynthesis glycosyltransferase